jgi:5-methylthioadenosine/S-adenosylhomocysteine deaminase
MRWRSMNLVGVMLVALAAGCPAPASQPDAAIVEDTAADPDTTVIVKDKDTLLLRGTVVTPDQVLPSGEVLTHLDSIICVGVSCAAEPLAKNATIVETAGIIYPGLIDAHNHTQYNYLPLWQHPQRFSNHNQWQASSGYSTFMAPHRDLEGSLMCEMIKYGEIRSLVAGTTTIQGTPLRKCADTLIRNADLPYSGLSAGDMMRTNVLGVSTLDAAAAAKLISDFDAGKARSYVIHLSEGIDETARQEFDVLESLGLLRPEVVIVHGTALKQAELTKVQQAGMAMIWSPSSNVDLYGATNDIGLVRQLGIPLALSPDWTPSGEPNLLDELRFVSELNKTTLGGMWTAKDLVLMVTTKAAAVLKLDAELGALRTGMRADLLVLKGDTSRPYDTLVDARLPQVRLVVVRGRALYGDPALLARLEPNAYCETTPICGAPKMICVKESESSTNKLNQSLGDIITALGQGYTPGILTLSTCE